MKRIQKAPLPLFRNLVYLAATLTIFTGCQTIRSAELQGTNALFSAEQEATLGQDYSKQIEEEIQIIDDPVIQKWVQDMGEKLVANSPPSDQTFTFKVTADESVNAFAIPGGFCYVNVGLIRYADNEAQVASVVGHEVNHVTKRHGMRSLQRAMGIQAVADIASSDPRAAPVAQAAANAGGVVAMRGFGRYDEREADKYGIEALYKAGYDPREGLRFFEKLQEYQESLGAGDGGFISQLMSSHPTTTERIENIREQIQAYPITPNLVKSTPQFDEVIKRLPPKPKK